MYLKRTGILLLIAMLLSTGLVFLSPKPQSRPKQMSLATEDLGMSPVPDIAKGTGILLLVALLLGTGLIVFLSPKFQPQQSQVGLATDLGTSPLPDIGNDGTALGVTSPSAGVTTSPVYRLQIPRAQVNAPVIELSVAEDGIMEAPGNPLDIAWYNFSSHPAQEGNVVLAGHVDYHNYGPAVLWKLRELVPGDEVLVSLSDGSSYLYEVTSLTAYEADNAPVGKIVGPSPGHVVTIITCIGNFDRRSGEYDKRLVVRGQLVKANN